MVGHRKGGIGPGRFPVKAARAIIKVIESAMENARHQYEDIDAEEMLITHIAAHRGKNPQRLDSTSPWPCNSK